MCKEPLKNIIFLAAYWFNLKTFLYKTTDYLSIQLLLRANCEGLYASMQVSQLRHDLSMKDELLQFYTSAAEESDGESASTTPWVHVLKG